MSPDEVHFLILLYLIYLSDCFLLPRCSAVMLYSRFSGTKLRVRTTESAAVFARRFWLLRPVFPPLGFSRSLEFARGSFGREGFSSVSVYGTPASGHAADERHVRYHEIESVRAEDGCLVINEECWFRFRDAQALAEDIESVAGSADRPAAIRSVIEKGFARGAEGREEIAANIRRTEWLNVFCSLYALALLVYLPVSLYRLTPLGLLWGVAVPLLLLHLVCGLLFLQAHRAAAGKDRWHRWESLLKMLLCPPMMIRAADVVNDQVEVKGDALAVMMGCVEKEQWMPVAQTIWRSLIPHERSDLAASSALAVMDYAEAYRSVFGEALREAGVNPVCLEVNAEEMPSDQRFCPRCESLYRVDMEFCPDCGGIPLRDGLKEVQ